MVVSWRPPQRNSEFIIRYEFQLAITSPRSKESFFAPGSPLRLGPSVVPEEGVWSGRVRAVSADGPGEYSQALTFESGGNTSDHLGDRDNDDEGMHTLFEDDDELYGEHIHGGELAQQGRYRESKIGRAHV